MSTHLLVSRLRAVMTTCSCVSHEYPDPKPWLSDISA